MAESVCRHCGQGIFERSDGVWTLEYIEWRPADFCWNSPDKIGFWHEPVSADALVLVP